MAPQGGAIGALIDEETRGVAGGKIETEAHSVFMAHRFEGQTGLAVNEHGGDSFVVLQRDEFAENATVLHPLLCFPSGQVSERGVACRFFLVGKQDIVAETLDPRRLR